MKQDEEHQIKEHIEDTTKYGEFISSYFAWVAPEAQRRNVERLENITNKNHRNIEK